MSHTNQTQHYQLPQFVGTDILNPLVDTNEAYQKIDETMYNVSQEAGNAASAVAQAVATVEAMNQRVEVVENEATELATGVEQTRLMLAEEFNALKSGGYNVGDFVINDNKIYEFINNHVGAWSASDVNEVSVTDVIKTLRTFSEQNRDMIGKEFDPTVQYLAGSYVIHNNKFYLFSANHLGAWTGTDVVEKDVAEVFRTVLTYHLMYDYVIPAGTTSAQAYADIHNKVAAIMGNLQCSIKVVLNDKTVSDMIYNNANDSRTYLPAVRPDGYFAYYSNVYDNGVAKSFIFRALESGNSVQDISDNVQGADAHVEIYIEG